MREMCPSAGEGDGQCCEGNAGQSGVLRRWVEEDLWDFTIGPDIHDKQCTGVAAVHGVRSVDMVGSK